MPVWFLGGGGGWWGALHWVGTGVFGQWGVEKWVHGSKQEALGPVGVQAQPKPPQRCSPTPPEAAEDLWGTGGGAGDAP